MHRRPSRLLCPGHILSLHHYIAASGHLRAYRHRAWNIRFSERFAHIGPSAYGQQLPFGRLI